MGEMIDFLNYIWDNIDDPRISINKKMKYGYRYFSVDINLPTKHARTASIHVDNRNNTIEISYDYHNSVIIESEELSKIWIDKFEQKYKELSPIRVTEIINSFMEETEPKGKDFWRDWTMNKIFNKE